MPSAARKTNVNIGGNHKSRSTHDRLALAPVSRQHLPDSVHRVEPPFADGIVEDDLRPEGRAVSRDLWSPARVTASAAGERRLCLKPDQPLRLPDLFLGVENTHPAMNGELRAAIDTWTSVDPEHDGSEHTKSPYGSTQTDSVRASNASYGREGTRAHDLTDVNHVPEKRYRRPHGQPPGQPVRSAVPPSVRSAAKHLPRIHQKKPPRKHSTGPY